MQSALRGFKRARSGSHDVGGVSGLNEDLAEASRRLPRLNARTLVRHDTSEEEDFTLSDADMEHTASMSTEGDTRRYTAEEKGKGKATRHATAPEVFEIDSDSSDEAPLAANESIQFISSSMVPSKKAVEEGKDTAEAIDEESAITAFSEWYRDEVLIPVCPVCFCAPTAPALTPW